MAITFVGQAGIAGGSGASPGGITYSSTTGNTLIVTGHLFDLNGGAFVAPTSVSDTAGNHWNVSTFSTQAAVTVQTPPLCSITDPSDGASAHIADFVAWSIGAAHVTSVTIAWEGGLSTWRRIALSEWSNIAQFDNSWANGSTSTSASVAAGPLQLRVPGELVVAAFDFGGSGTQSLPSGWTELTSAGAADCGYYLPPSSTGSSYSPVWTVTAAGSWAGAHAVFSPVFLSSTAKVQAVRARLAQNPPQSQQVYQPGLIYARNG